MKGIPWIQDDTFTVEISPEHAIIKLSQDIVASKSCLFALSLGIYQQGAMMDYFQDWHQAAVLPVFWKSVSFT